MLINYGLRQDPFAIVPSNPVENWAGMSQLKDELLDIVLGVRARDIGSSEFVVLHGELGSGKSHAFRYLKTHIERNDQDFRSLAVYVERPRVASKLNFLELYKYIITKIGREKITKICKDASDRVNDATNVIAKSAGFDQSNNLATFHSKVLDKERENRNMFELLLHGASNNDEVFKFLAGSGKCPCTAYEGQISSDFMAAKVLGDFFRTITTKLDDTDSVFESVYLFVDECEVLFDARVTESDPVFSGFREIIDGAPYGLGLFLSFTAATALIEAYMPQNLLKRMTHSFIEIPMLEDDAAVDFLKEHLDWFRPEESEYNQTLYPFTEETIENIVEHQTSLTPRNLFRDCRRVLERSIRRYHLQPGEEITAEVAEDILHHRL